MQSTNEVVSDISGRLTALEPKVENLDSKWKKKVVVVQSVLKGVPTSAELFALTEWVILIEGHMKHVREVLQLADNEQ